MLKLQTSMLYIKSHLEKLKSLFRSFTEVRSFEQLSRNVHLLVVVLLLLQTFFVTIFRYKNYPFSVVIINLSEISAYTLSLLLYFKKNYTASVLVAAFSIPIIYSIAFFSLPFVTFESCLWFLLCFMLIYIFIIYKKSNRIIYVTCCTAIFFIPAVLITFTYPGNLIKFAQLATLISIPMILATFIENQDKKLQQLNKDLHRKYHEKKNDAERLNEKNDELIVFSHIMSHDLKSPLSTIKAFAGLLIKDTEKREDNEKHLKYLNFILNSTDSMSNLINDLLIYSKIETDDYVSEGVNLQSIIEEILPLFQFDIMDKQVEIEINELPVIQGNPNIIKTVFQNLISNSIKYQPKDKPNHHPKIVIWSKENETHHQVFIQDNGIGIKEEYVDDLFAPFKKFHSNKEYKGTGLGMSICRRIMEKQKGNIYLHSTSENGSTFKLRFPKAA